jgi:catechol 2,3-dioxygenase-like lactoylglutathione lyase family enzyme
VRESRLHETEEDEMLGDSPAIATIAVKDIDSASRFYEGTLGLSRLDVPNPDPTAVLYRVGGSALLVYQSTYAGTNQATYASWAVGDDVEGVVDGLKSKGVTFEQYDDLPGVTREGDLHVIAGFKAAWFKDPDGNILNITNQSAM